MNYQFVYKLIGGIFLFSLAAVITSVYSLLYTVSGSDAPFRLVVEKGESVYGLSERLNSEGIIYTPALFRYYLKWRGIDRQIQAGEYTVDPPVTIARIAKTFRAQPTEAERTITIIPGWDWRDISEYFEKEGIASEEDFYALAGEPARFYDPPQAAVGANRLAPVLPFDLAVLQDWPRIVSYEGYLAPETYRIFSDATLAEIIAKLMAERDKQFTAEMYDAIKASGRTVHEILTVASLVEREVKKKEDRHKVADIFWRRVNAGWGLQADSTVHYASGRKGDVFTTKKERELDSPWNTYKYAGLPPSPICNPSFESIQAAIYPEKNEYWYFLTTLEGEVKYAQTLEEHNRNVGKYLR